jgi:rhamnose transport system ATP-binding protein
MLLEAKSIKKTFAGVHALKGVDFDLSPGEVHALIGENGAGKSTLIKVMTGAVQPDSGVLLVSGRAAANYDPSVARSLGIAAIYQQPALFPHLSVAENLALGLETGGFWRRIDWKARKRRTLELIESVGAHIEPDRLVSTLSMPEQQLVEIAKAVGADARIFIMDEPTASLTEKEVTTLFELIRNLRRRGVGLVYISHRLEEVSTLADRITILRDGESVATVSASEVDRPAMIRMMVGRELSTVFPKRDVPIADVALEIRHLGNRSRGLHDVSLSVRRGEILGIAGLVGSGRTELAETLFGLTPADTGEIVIGSVPVEIHSPADAIKSGIAYVPEDRRQHGVVLALSITANASLANLDSVSTHKLIDGSKERAQAGHYVHQLRIKTESVESDAGTLSGGNQQKVALARWLATNPSVLILDEPTQGVDVGSKSEIHTLMMDLLESGLAIIMISSELPEILGMSDRIVVMRRGAISGILSRQEATQAKIMSLALGESAEGFCASNRMV